MFKTKLFYSIVLLFFLLSCMTNNENASRPEGTPGSEESAFYKFKIKSLDGDTIDFSKYKGKKVLIVNTASKCGFTPQYEALQELHMKYGDKVTVLGFPCNQFGGQEPGTNKEIGEFCQKNYGVSFQMFDKVDVKGKDQHPLYKWLSDKSLNGWNDKDPSWNFCKYLVNEKGELVNFWNSTASPTGNKILEEINK